MLEPLIVAPSQVGGHMVLFEHRRREAAIAAELAAVPCIVRADYTAKDAKQIADMLAENLHRADLTAVEEADGYAQLAAFDWTAEQIAAESAARPIASGTAWPSLSCWTESGPESPQVSGRWSRQPRSRSSPTTSRPWPGWPR